VPVTLVQAGKYVTEDKSKTDITQTKHKPEKANNVKYSRTKLARKRGGLILRYSQISCR